ncbi:hypothetical protein PR048_013505 [Dryococelus australis]|uniref:Uncharacterized protein n=1 Tax=Dryococelus australis TaxID=614101 RepID=A0ABQ9HT67_9NEOP|nr:hypothetical protein PR048_013505 [Dryococelus australis]
MHKCSTNFSEESRTKLCQEYTKADFKQQEMLLSTVKRSQTERKQKCTGEGVGQGMEFRLLFPEMERKLGCGEEKAQLEEEYQQHLIRRNEANLCKEEDKKRATMEKKFVSASFDLQRVLHMPCFNQSPLYYSRRFCAYNLKFMKQQLQTRHIALLGQRLMVKQKDLLKFCSSGVIPKEYHPWYQDIPSTMPKKDDRIAEPSIDE